MTRRPFFKYSISQLESCFGDALGNRQLLEQIARELSHRKTQRAQRLSVRVRGEGIVGVNGPPGTGKTTLLRDVVASVVVARAEAMSGLSDPESAFQHAGKMRMGTSWCHLYRLKEEIKGHEIVVASSNNKAVENISKELPGLAALADACSLRYFSTVSDATAGASGETWGLIAAVLGNATNRYTFSQAAWSNPDTSLKSYLLAATGREPRPVEDVDPRTGRTIERPPRIVTAEDPPNGKEAALQRWKVAREAFRSSLALARNILEALERGRQHALALGPLLDKLERADQTERDVQQRHDSARVDAQAAEEECTGLSSPDVFVITPFVIVKQEMRRLLAASDVIAAWAENPWQWVGERVGTVHTFQGKEAEAVFLVLGAPNVAQEGARSWAGTPPNLLNVAATRAKSVLYVVGSREMWKGNGSFVTLDRKLP